MSDIGNDITDANLFNAQEEIGALGSDSVQDAVQNNTLLEEQGLSPDELLQKLNDEILELNAIKAGLTSFNINQDEKFFYERKIRPLVDIIYFMSLSSNSVATTADTMQRNTYGKKREIRQALDLSHDINKELEELFKTLRKRTKIFREGIDQAVELGESISEPSNEEK